ncbi:MAG: hypothetical protein ACK5NC_14630 [Vibrio sp.]
MGRHHGKYDSNQTINEGQELLPIEKSIYELNVEQMSELYELLEELELSK